MHDADHFVSARPDKIGQHAPRMPFHHQRLEPAHTMKKQKISNALGVENYLSASRRVF
jgi:hypothetical protein